MRGDPTGKKITKNTIRDYWLDATPSTNEFSLHRSTVVNIGYHCARSHFRDINNARTKLYDNFVIYFFFFHFFLSLFLLLLLLVGLVFIVSQCLVELPIAMLCIFEHIYIYIYAFHARYVVPITANKLSAHNIFMSETDLYFACLCRAYILFQFNFLFPNSFSLF